MASKLLEFNMEMLGKLVESSEAPQNFVESVINDLPESSAKSITDVEVVELKSIPLAEKSAASYEHINGVVFSCKTDGQKTELYLILEPVTYLKWWHDKSFFSSSFYRAHSHANDNVKRYLTYVITDDSVKASRFHNISYFNNKDGEKDTTFQIHDIVAIKETGNEDSMLENWIRALVSKPASTQDKATSNVSNISDAKSYRVA